MELATIMPINSIAKLIRKHDTRIWRVVNHYVEEAREKEDYSEVKSTGIDETSSKRGHNYRTVFVDLEESKVHHSTVVRTSRATANGWEKFFFSFSNIFKYKICKMCYTNH